MTFPSRRLVKTLTVSPTRPSSSHPTPDVQARCLPCCMRCGRRTHVTTPIPARTAISAVGSTRQYMYRSTCLYTTHMVRAANSGASTPTPHLIHHAFVTSTCVLPHPSTTPSYKRRDYMSVPSLLTPSVTLTPCAWRPHGRASLVSFFSLTRHEMHVLFSWVSSGPAPAIIWARGMGGWRCACIRYWSD